MRLLTFAAIFVAASPASAQTVYVLGVDQSEGSATLGSFDLTGDNAFVYNPINNELGGGTNYANLTSNGAGGFYATTDNFDTLVTVSTSGAIDVIEEMGTTVAGLARDTNETGTVYAYDYDWDQVGTVNTTTGEFAAIGRSGVIQTNVYGTLAFAGGTLYAVSRTFNNESGTIEGNLHSVDIDTGAFSMPINTDPNDVYIDMIVFGVGSYLYGINTVYSKQVEHDVHTVYSIGLDTGKVSQFGVLTAGSDLLDNFRFQGAAALNPVPEPVTGLGLSAAGLGLAGWIRRRRAEASATVPTPSPSA